MLSKERKSFLADVCDKFRESEGWCKGLTSDEDVEFIRSQGFTGVRLIILLYVFLPLQVAISTGFNGVPYFVSFLKRRLKSVFSSSKKEKSKKKKEHRSNFKSGSSIVVKCCKSCESTKLRKVVDQEFKKKKTETVEGKGPRTRQNYLRRLRKKIRKNVSKEAKDVYDSKHFEPVADYEFVSYTQSSYRKRILKRADRLAKRSKDFESGAKILSKDGLFFHLLKIPRSFPIWAEQHILKHYVIKDDKILDNGVDVFDDLLTKYGKELAVRLGRIPGRWSTDFSKIYARIYHSEFKRFVVSNSGSGSHSSSRSRFNSRNYY